LVGHPVALPGHQGGSTTDAGSTTSPEFCRYYGSEFVSAAMDLWAYTHGVILDFSRRGKPTDNAVIESFNGR